MVSKQKIRGKNLGNGELVYVCVSVYNQTQLLLGNLNFAL